MKERNKTLIYFAMNFCVLINLLFLVLEGLGDKYALYLQNEANVIVFGIALIGTMLLLPFILYLSIILAQLMNKEIIYKDELKDSV